MKKDKLSLTKDDLYFLNQYLVLNFSDLKGLKTVFLMFKKDRENIFNFIKEIDPDHMKKTDLVYINNDYEQNKILFDEDSNRILDLGINKELIDFLENKLSNAEIFSKIDSRFSSTFKKGFAFITVLVGVFFVTIFALGKQFLQFKGMNAGGRVMDISVIEFFYEYSIPLSLVFYFGMMFFVAAKFFRHRIFYAFNFSRTYVLLAYKEKLLGLITSHYFERSGKSEILYMDLKGEFGKIVNGMKRYLPTNDYIELNTFLEKPIFKPTIENSILKKEFVSDYQNLMKFQNIDAKGKLRFYNELKYKIVSINKNLEHIFQNELEKIGSFLELFFSLGYIILVAVITGVIIPIIISVV